MEVLYHGTCKADMGIQNLNFEQSKAPFSPTHLFESYSLTAQPANTVTCSVLSATALCEKPEE